MSTPWSPCVQLSVYVAKVFVVARDMQSSEQAAQQQRLAAVISAPPTPQRPAGLALADAAPAGPRAQSQHSCEKEWVNMRTKKWRY